MQNRSLRIIKEFSIISDAFHTLIVEILSHLFSHPTLLSQGYALYTKSYNSVPNSGVKKTVHNEFHVWPESSPEKSTQVQWHMRKITFLNSLFSLGWIYWTT